MNHSENWLADVIQAKLRITNKTRIIELDTFVHRIVSTVGNSTVDPIREGLQSQHIAAK